MLAAFVQFLFSGVAVGTIYAFSALGFTLIFNASKVINFAQGEFIMRGGMLAVLFVNAGLPAPLAALLAVVLPALAGMLIEKAAIRPAGNAEVISLIIITIGLSLVIRGLVQITLGKEAHTLAPFSDGGPIHLMGAVLHPQTPWIIGVTGLVMAGLWFFFHRTLYGKMILATSFNRLAAQLMGIDTRRVMSSSYGMAAGLGALGGLLITPMTMTSYDVGIMLGLKGFVGAVLGGMGNGLGAVAGGLLVGIAEALVAGYISSAYKDAVPFLLIFAILFLRPQGLFGAKTGDRV